MANPKNPFTEGSQSEFLYKVYAESKMKILPTDSEILAKVRERFTGTYATRESLQTLTSQLRRGIFTAGKKVDIPRQRRSRPVYKSQLKTSLEKT